MVKHGTERQYVRVCQSISPQLNLLKGSNLPRGYHFACSFRIYYKKCCIFSCDSWIMDPENQFFYNINKVRRPIFQQLEVYTCEKKFLEHLYVLYQDKLNNVN